MGYTFTNIQLRKAGKYDKSLADSIASSVANGRGWKLIDNPDEADAATVIASSEASGWIAVFSDAFDGDPDAAIQAAHGLSETLQTDALAIGCFDSDYLFMNLLNPSEGINLWASSGSAAAAGLSGMRRSNFRAWSSRVKDAGAFKEIMKRQRVFAEECLSDLEEILGLPALQSMGGTDREDMPGTYRYYYAAEEDGPAEALPVLEWLSPPVYAPRAGEEGLLQAVNRGGASRGVGIAFMGDAVEKGDVAVYTATIQVYDSRGEWKFYSVEINETMASDGRKMLYGELLHFPLPRAVSNRLPWYKKLDVEFQRAIVLRYVPEVLHAHLDGNLLTGLTVHMIPLKNWQGQCGWRGRPMDKAF